MAALIFNRSHRLLQKPNLFPTSRSVSSSVGKEALLSRLLSAKDESKKSFDEISAHLGLTNVYTAQLFMNQAQLKPDKVKKLKEIVPAISDEDLAAMQRFPFRSFDPQVNNVSP